MHLFQEEMDLVNGPDMSDQAHPRCSKRVIEPSLLGPFSVDLMVKPQYVETIQNIEQRSFTTMDQTWSTITNRTFLQGVMQLSQYSVRTHLFGPN